MKIEQVQKIMRRIIEEILLRKRAKEATGEKAGFGGTEKATDVGRHGTESGLKRKASGRTKNAFDGKAREKSGKRKSGAKRRKTIAEKGGKDGK